MEFWLPANGGVDFQAQVLSSSSSIHLGFHVLHCLWHLTNMVRFCFLNNPRSFWKSKIKFCLFFWGPCNDPRVIDFWVAWYCLWVFWIWKESNCSVRKSYFLERIPPPPPFLLPLYYCVITLNVFHQSGVLWRGRIHFFRFQKCYSNRSFAAFWSGIFVVGER